MAWTTPAAGAIITSANSKILYDSDAYTRTGSAFWSTVATFGAVSAAGTPEVATFCYTDALAAYGTVQARVSLIYNLTVLGACTSLTPRVYLNVNMAALSLASIGVNREIQTGTALTGGTLTTGWKQIDTGWVSLASLTTDLSGYGITSGSLRYHFTAVTGNPTIVNAFAYMHFRVA